MSASYHPIAPPRAGDPADPLDRLPLGPSPDRLALSRGETLVATVSLSDP